MNFISKILVGILSFNLISTGAASAMECSKITNMQEKHLKIILLGTDFAAKQKLFELFENDSEKEFNKLEKLSKKFSVSNDDEELKIKNATLNLTELNNKKIVAHAFYTPNEVFTYEDVCQLANCDLRGKINEYGMYHSEDFLQDANIIIIFLGKEKSSTEPYFYPSYWEEKAKDQERVLEKINLSNRKNAELILKEISKYSNKVPFKTIIIDPYKITKGNYKNSDNTSIYYNSVNNLEELSKIIKTELNKLNFDKLSNKAPDLWQIRKYKTGCSTAKEKRDKVFDDMGFFAGTMGRLFTLNLAGSAPSRSMGMNDSLGSHRKEYHLYICELITSNDDKMKELYRKDGILLSKSTSNQESCNIF